MNPTDAFIAITVGLFLGSWLVYDIAVAAYYRPKCGVQTITHEVIRLSRLYPVIPFLAGFVGGFLSAHFWGCF